MSEKRWVVRAGDGRTVGDVLARMREDARAIDEGRVFLGKKRVLRLDTPVREGDAVRVGAAERRTPVTILFEDGGLVACVKPAGIPTVPDHAGGAHALVAEVARTIGRRADALRVTSRLDREVSGVVVFALDAEAEARLRRARDEGRYVRRYVAIGAASASRVAPGTVWDAPIGGGKDPRHRAPNGPDAKAARTRVVFAKYTDMAVLLAVEPVTGRTHQIRVHAAHAGMPLFGDRDYGGPTRLTLPGGRVVSLARIALHAGWVRVPDAKGEPLVARAPIPDELARLWSELGGSGDDWPVALAEDLAARA